MRPLLDNRFAPLTWEVGFLETSADRAADEFARWRRQLGRLEERDVHGELPSLLCSLSPVTDGEPKRFLFVGTDGDWTAFFDNLAYGTDSFGPMSVLARDLGVRAVKARWVPDVPESPAERRGSVIFELFGPEETDFLNTERVVAVIHDGDRWTFDEVGTPLPFEDRDAYGARRKRDRFTPELLDEYLRNLGIRMFDEEFYGPDRAARLFERRGRLERGAGEYPVRACAETPAARAADEKSEATRERGR